MTEEAPPVVDGPEEEPPISKALIKYYTNTKVIRASKALETIFEETDQDLVDGSSKISRRKLRRAINFPQLPDDPKRWRGVKKGKKKGMKRKKGFKKSLKEVTKKALMEKLAEIEQDEEN